MNPLARAVNAGLRASILGAVVAVLSMAHSSYTLGVDLHAALLSTLLAVVIGGGLLGVPVTLGVHGWLVVRGYFLKRHNAQSQG